MVNDSNAAVKQSSKGMEDLYLLQVLGVCYMESLLNMITWLVRLITHIHICILFVSHTIYWLNVGIHLNICD